MEKIDIEEMEHSMDAHLAISTLVEKINEIVEFINIMKDGYPENCRLCGKNHDPVEHTYV